MALQNAWLNICHDLLCVPWVKVSPDCFFCWYCWNCWPSLFKLSFIICCGRSCWSFFYLFYDLCISPSSLYFTGTVLEHLDSRSAFWRVRVVHVLSFLWCVFCFVRLRFVSCSQCRYCLFMYCPFLIASSVLNVDIVSSFIVHSW